MAGNGSREVKKLFNKAKLARPIFIPYIGDLPAKVVGASPTELFDNASTLFLLYSL